MRAFRGSWASVVTERASGGRTTSRALTALARSCVGAARRRYRAKPPAAPKVGGEHAPPRLSNAPPSLARSQTCEASRRAGAPPLAKTHKQKRARHTLVVPQLVRPSFACALRAHAYLLVARMWGLVGPTPLWRPFGFVNCLIRQVTNRPSVHACDMLSHTGGGTSTVAPDPERRPSRPTVQLLASHQPLQRMHAMQSSLNQSAIRTRR